MSSQLHQQLQSSLAGAYDVERELGRGAMATVFLARDIKHRRPVALKVLDPELAASLGAERFLAEIRLTANLQHPNILPLFDSGEIDGLLFYVMPFVAGESLRARLENERLMPIEEAVRIAGAIAAALDYAHRHGVAHRDIKPENILLSEGVPMIADFGIAKAIANSLVLPNGASAGLTQAGLTLGTPSYMSPEQATGDEIDGRSDVYALGCMLYEMLSGEVPFRGPSARSVIAKHLTDPVPSVRAARESVPASIGAALLRAMSKDPSERFQTAADFASALASPLSYAATIEEPVMTSVAVLPFVFLSDTDNARALSLGFADALITIFGNLPDVIVAPTSAILGYAAGANPQEVCRDLRVRHALQGTVQKHGSHWRVSIQLFDATIQRIAFSDKHDFEMDDMFEVQDEIGRRVVQSLESRFVAKTASRERYSSDPEAYNDFITGLRESFSDEERVLRAAADHLASAVERDPEFALAHATLSMVAANFYFLFDPQHSWMEKAEHHCALALSLDPTLPEGHLARAWILWSPAKNFQHAEAIAALEMVLAARPNLERAHNRMAGICLHIGRLDEARAVHERARRTNPMTRTGNLEFYYIYSGDFESAENLTEEWYRERPQNLNANYARILPPLLSGDLELAQERLSIALEQAPDVDLLVSLEGILHARRGEAELAVESVRRALDSPRSFGHAHHSYYQIACTYALLGKTEMAMGWLERSVETGFACAPFFRLDPNLESLRGKSSFERLVSDIERTHAALEIKRI